MAVQMTKIRGFIASVVAVVLLIVFAGIVAAAMDLNIPVIRGIGEALGF